MFLIFRIIRSILFIIFDVLAAVVVVDAILSWIPTIKQNKFTVAVNLVADIVLAPIRAVLRSFRVSTPIDISPLVAIIVLQILRVIVRAIFW